MIDLKDKPYFPLVEQIVDAICVQTQNSDRHFFRTMVNFHLALIPSMLRVNIKSDDRGIVPINVYAFAFAGSGYSKGHSLAIIEEQILNKFMSFFLEDTFQVIAEKNLFELATRRSIKKGTEFDEELKEVEKEYRSAGKFLSVYSEGTAPALKQMRTKLLQGIIGSLNLVVDEFGSNMYSLEDLLGVYLEGYDKGRMKDKLIKNTKDNTRNEEIQGFVPCNLLAFGTPASIFDGGKVEEKFDGWQNEGYARRSFFAYSTIVNKEHKLTAIEVFKLLKNSLACEKLKEISEYLGTLADVANYNNTIYSSEEVSITMIQYKMDCEDIASTYGEHEGAKKAEMEHRYFKASKLMGMYAFLDNSHEIKLKHLYAAIKYTEDSGEHFHKMLVREKPYVRLAKYLASIDSEVTQVDLIEANVLKGSESQKRELITLATAYGYKNNIIIKTIYLDGIQFLKGESLKETNLDKLILACSTQLADNYNPVVKNTSWKDLHILTQMDGYHWINHHMIDNYRLEKNAIPGFNMVVIDVDGGISLATAQLLLKEYTYLIYTTKRHTDKENRFRIVFPISHELKLNAEDFTEFMQNIYAWLPFKVDDQTAQRSRKWLSHKGEYQYNEGTLLDALGFIPKTAKESEQKKFIADTQSLSNMERWFTQKATEGNRSNQLIKYALMLVDSGLNEDVIQSKVLELNSKLPNKLEEVEIHTTILKTVYKALAKRDN